VQVPACSESAVVPVQRWSSRMRQT